MWKAVQLLVLVLCVIAMPTRADDASLAAAKELFNIMSPQLMDQMVAQSTASVWPEIASDMTKKKIDTATQSEIRAKFEHVVKIFVDEEMIEAPKIYAKYFSTAELRELTAFYQTPTGSKALRVMPNVMGDTLSLVGSKTALMQQEMKTQVNSVLRKHNYQP
jgi:hypothetical protein